MPRFKLTIEYNGTRFHGWQYQRDVPTIMGKLQEAIQEVFKTDDFELYGSGRTDAGVHALGQVAHLQINTAMPPYIALVRINEKLPSSINILNISKMEPKFHARHNAILRSYVYHISKRRSAFGRNFSWWVQSPLNVKAMADATVHLIGMKDFSSFGVADKEEKSTLVNLEVLKIFEIDDSIIIHLVGSHFLWKMVRRIVGTLVEVGKEKILADEMGLFLTQKSDFPARHTAPANGLFLEHVYYPGDKVDLEPIWLMNILSKR
ncbi:MAG: tRNA pseudouridine(38-40) synthase TruA [Salinivirgaceae bacterium]|nr:tRNA pseudouridine(38-40) synthase TruA [Salinivirgaceae bacterium]MDD4745923.1 tRNA pseudouridine(38-40) synthase TruA [Salinivirgaceae bacterium]MDY0279731.1 tRNA pseudouridine(38-40) synthase TruA [Salinivirgaceae bacterium]